MNVHAVDDGEATAWTSGAVPRPARIRDRIWMLPTPMESNPMRYALSYIIEDDDGRLHVIDPGWPSPRNDESFTAFLGSIGHTRRDVDSITVTHHHPDHAGAAHALREASGAPIHMHVDEDPPPATPPPSRPDSAQLDAWGVPARERERLTFRRIAVDMPPPPSVDVPLRGGDLLPISGRSVEVVATPGHTSGHICLAAREEGLLFSGDHLMPTVHCGLGLGGTMSGNALAIYLASLDAVRPFAAGEIAPGHQYRFRGGQARIDSTAYHHLRRCDGVRALAVERMSMWEIASRLPWRGGWSALSGFYLYSALRQTEMYVDFVAASLRAGSERPS